MDIANILADALKAVEAAQLPKEFQQVAFEKAVEILSGQSAPAVAPVSHPSSGRQLVGSCRPQRTSRTRLGASRPSWASIGRVSSVSITLRAMS